MVVCILWFVTFKVGDNIKIIFFRLQGRINLFLVYKSLEMYVRYIPFQVKDYIYPCISKGINVQARTCMCCDISARDCLALCWDSTFLEHLCISCLHLIWTFLSMMRIVSSTFHSHVMYNYEKMKSHYCLWIFSLPWQTAIHLDASLALDLLICAVF